MRSFAIVPIRRLSAGDLAGVSARAASTTRRARNTQRRRSLDSAYCAGSSWPAGGCSAAIPGATGASIPSRTSGCSRPRDRPERLTMLVPANIFQPLIDVFESVLKFFHNSVGVPWGWSIVLLTVVIRALLLPLTLKQFHSMQRLQRLRPEMKAIQTKYKEDKQRQQQEMMKFYKENQVNPLGSCLPLVAQLPVFISLFYMLRSSLRGDICPQPQPGAHCQRHVGRIQPCAYRCLRSQPRRWLPVRPRPDQQGHRRGAGGADRALRRDPARLQPDDVEPDDGQDAAADHAGDAAVLRHLHHQLPGRRDRLLDHHEHVDDPSAVLREETNRHGRCPGRYRRRQRRGRAGRRRLAGERWPIRRQAEDADPSGANGSDAATGGLGARLRSRIKNEEPAPVGTKERPRAAPPPRPPRKKKKRSGRRR